jgi:hypothetical protein
MNAKRFLTHVIVSQPRTVVPLHNALREHIKENFSREKFRKVLKERLHEERRREMLTAELRTLENELSSIRSTHNVRAQKLAHRVSELQRKLDKKI